MVYFTALLTGCHVTTAFAGDPVTLSPEGGVASLMRVTVVLSGGGVRICDGRVAGRPTVRATAAIVRTAKAGTRMLASSLWKWMWREPVLRSGF
jgi:hypothetical protein